MRASIFSALRHPVNGNWLPWIDKSDCGAMYFLFFLRDLFQSTQTQLKMLLLALHKNLRQGVGRGNSTFVLVTSVYFISYQLALHVGISPKFWRSTHSAVYFALR